MVFFLPKKSGFIFITTNFPLKKTPSCLLVFFKPVDHQPEYLQLTFSRYQVFPNRFGHLYRASQRANSSAAQPIGPHESSVSLRPGTKPVVFHKVGRRIAARRDLYGKHIYLSLGGPANTPPDWMSTLTELIFWERLMSSS